MKLETIMKRIQENDLILTGIVPETTYEFAYDLNIALKNIAHYQIKYYTRCEDAGLTYEEATEKLGDFLKAGLGFVKNEE